MLSCYPAILHLSLYLSFSLISLYFISIVRKLCPLTFFFILFSLIPLPPSYTPFFFLMRQFRLLYFSFSILLPFYLFSSHYLLIALPVLRCSFIIPLYCASHLILYHCVFCRYQDCNLCSVLSGPTLHFKQRRALTSEQKIYFKLCK